MDVTSEAKKRRPLSPPFISPPLAWQAHGICDRNGIAQEWHELLRHLCQPVSENTDWERLSVGQKVRCLTAGATHGTGRVESPLALAEAWPPQRVSTGWLGVARGRAMHTGPAEMQAEPAQGPTGGQAGVRLPPPAW